MNENGHSEDNDPVTDDYLLSIAVREALSRSEPLRMSSLDLIHVQAAAGKIVLTGMVASEVLKYLAARLAADVPGVEAVENRLVAWEDVERKVALALASAEDTRHLRINLHMAEDGICLHGAVASQQESDAATRVAAAAAGTVPVRNEIEVVPPGTPVMVLDQHSVEGRLFADEPVGAGQGNAGPGGEASTTSTGNPPASMVGGTA